MEQIKNNLEGVMDRILKQMPLGDTCPLADKTKRPKWKCGIYDRGGETFCKNVSGYSKCPHYVKWFYWNLWRMVAKEIAKLEIEQKKKNQKENVM
jgi:hypothetical protein